MSSLATFYILPDSKFGECKDAHQNQKTIAYKKTFFGRKEVTTGERFFWEYLEQATRDRLDLPYSGFAFIEYFLNFLPRELPEDLEADFNASALDDNYYLFTHPIATRFVAYLKSNQPDAVRLREFVQEQDADEVNAWVESISGTHDFSLQWFERITVGNFGVIHLTF